MGHYHCSVCELLRDFYGLKVNRFLLTLRSVPTSHNGGHDRRANHEQEIHAAKVEALRALCALVSHLKACYAIDRLRVDSSHIDFNTRRLGHGGLRPSVT